MCAAKDTANHSCQHVHRLYTCHKFRLTSKLPTYLCVSLSNYHALVMSCSALVVYNAHTRIYVRTTYPRTASAQFTVVSLECYSPSC